ncbi:hypothetical protein [Jeongeupia chitinilytica]|uniref:Pilus assembly protein PilO n=1 Tax=Jeongeupia chitinilytica TaxID=1041641 RepID=A0ABQ3H3Z0_9NEIS|nr:hypothetical protein [Jeongeupia chitinilytica]GHD66150.1 hypothetical protein GCM10007350_27990 [Jeongeupia chitinilytica]
MKPQQLIWHLRKWPRYAGTLGWVGLALIGMAVVLLKQQVEPVEQDLDKRELAVATKREELRRVVRASDVASEAAYVRLRRDTSFTAFLGELSELAAKNGIGVVQSDYKSVTEGDGHLMRFGLQFPAGGTYPSLRAFMRELSAIPGVRIESVSMSRQQIGEEMLAIQLQLSYLTEVGQPQAVGAR